MCVFVFVHIETVYSMYLSVHNHLDDSSLWTTTTESSTFLSCSFMFFFSCVFHLIHLRYVCLCFSICARARLCISFNSDIFCMIKKKKRKEEKKRCISLSLSLFSFYIFVLSFVHYKFLMFHRWTLYLLVARSYTVSIHPMVKNQSLNTTFIPAVYRININISFDTFYVQHQYASFLLCG